MFLKKKIKKETNLFIKKKLKIDMRLLKIFNNRVLSFKKSGANLVPKKKKQRCSKFFFIKKIFVILLFTKVNLISQYEVSWIRTNDGTTNRFTVCRFNHSAITSYNNNKSLSIFLRGAGTPVKGPITATFKLTQQSSKILLETSC